MGDEPKRPPGLRARGRRYWDAITAEYDLTLTELELLRELCQTMDELDMLRTAVRKDGVISKGSTGQTVTHPAIGEMRLHRHLISRLAGQLTLPDPEDGTAVPSPRMMSAQKAANARWDKQRARWGSNGPA